MSKEIAKEKINYTSSKSDIWKAYKEATSVLGKNETLAPATIKEITKTNNGIKESLTHLKSQLVVQLDASLVDLASKFSQAEEMLLELKQAIAKQHDQLEEEVSRIQIERKREEEEYTYDFTRRKQRQEEDLKDQKNIADAEVAQEKAELKKQQDELTSLRKQAEAFDARLAVEVNEATENTEKELRMQFEHEKALSSQKYESQNVLSQQKIDSLSETIKNQQQEIVRLNKALSDANVQVTSIAEKAVGQKYSAPTSGSANNVEV